MSNVIGVRSAMAIAARARYRVGERHSSRSRLERRKKPAPRIQRVAAAARRSPRPRIGDREFERAVRGRQGAGTRRMPPIRPSSDDITAGAESEHEHGHHQRRGIDRVSEHVPEDPDPDDLINQPAQTRTQEEKVDGGCRLTSTLRKRACRPAWPGSRQAADGYFCARPLSTSAT